MKHLKPPILERCAPSYDLAASTTDAVRETRAGDVQLLVFYDITAAEPFWREIERCNSHTLFQSYDWAAAWQKTVGAASEIECRVYIGFLGSEPVYLAARAIETTGRTRIAGPVGGIHAATHADIIAKTLQESGNVTAVCSAIARVIETDIKADTVIVRGARKDARYAASDTVLAFTGTGRDAAHISHLAPWSAFEPAHRTDKQRRDDRRNSKRLYRLGDVAFSVLEDPFERVATLDLMFNWKSRQFAELGVHDRYGDPAARQFFQQLVADSRDLTPILGVLKAGSQTAAVILGAGCGDTVHGLVTAISPDPAIRRGSPGCLAFELYLKALCDAGCYEKVDFGIGGNAIKDRWCDGIEEIAYRYEAHSLRGVAVCLRQTGRELAKHVLNRYPALASHVYSHRRKRVASQSATATTVSSRQIGK